MTTTVTMPRLGDTVDEVTVLEWDVAVGDDVQQGDILMRVETDKAIAEVPSPVSGRLVELLVAGDDEVGTGQPIAVLESG